MHGTDDSVSIIGMGGCPVTKPILYFDTIWGACDRVKQEVPGFDFTHTDYPPKFYNPEAYGIVY